MVTEEDLMIAMQNQHLATDADCDGVLTAEDCDDNSAESTYC